MSTSEQDLQEWMNSKEGEHCEFKEAKNRYDFEELVKYCVALANKGGGRLVLGVSDKRPRQVVGTQAFDQPERTRGGLIDRLRLRIDFDEIPTPNGRVLVFHVPCRPVGVPVQDKGVYWVREADRLVPMSEEELRRVFAESGHDFSADVCPKATLANLDPAAIEDFRRRWIAKSGNQGLAKMSHDQLLADADLITPAGVTYAALILFGINKSLGRFLAQAEVTFEYRSSEAAGPAQTRKDYRQGFFSFYDDLWDTINLRNDLQHYQDGLFVLDVPTFAERPIREAILNAVSHRDYQLAGNVFVRQFPRRIEITSPGGLPFQITLENILDRQAPRNRRIAEAFLKCGLVERAGQGMNLIFEETIKQSKPVPDFSLTDKHQVGITLHGTMQDPNFVRFLKKIGEERTAGFTTADFLILDLVHRAQKIPNDLQRRLPLLRELGVIERVGRGKHLLSRRYYTFIGRKGAYTRKRGLDREQNKASLLKHIADNRGTGSPMQELMDVLPSLSRGRIKTLLRELRKEGKAHPAGTKRVARWFPGPESQGFGSENRESTQ